MMCSKPKQSSLEKELTDLRLENEQLKRKLAEKQEEKQVDKLVLSPARSANDLTPWNLSKRVQEKISKKGFLESFKKTEITEDLLVDKSKNIEWWTLVSRAKPISLEDNVQYSQEKNLLDGPYVLINEKDIVEAVAIFIAQCVMSDAETSTACTDDLRKRLNGSFQELQEKGMLRKAWDWASFLHCASSWTLTAFEIYSDPTMVKVVLGSILNSAGWLGLGSKLTATAMSIFGLMGQKLSSLKV